MFEQWAVGTERALMDHCDVFPALGGVHRDLRGVYLGASPGGAEGESGDDIGIQTVNSSEWKHTHTHSISSGKQKKRGLFF